MNRIGVGNRVVVGVTLVRLNDAVKVASLKSRILIAKQKRPD